MGKESACQCKRLERRKFDPWVRKIPLEEGMATHSGSHREVRERTWRKSSPSGTVWVAGVQCPGFLTEQKASSTEEGFQVRALK